MPREVSQTGELTHSLEAACGLQGLRQSLCNFSRTRAKSSLACIIHLPREKGSALSLCRRETLTWESLDVLQQGLAGHCGARGTLQNSCVRAEDTLLCSDFAGAHLNAAITLTHCILGNLPWRKLPAYLIGQFLGSFVASATVFAMYYGMVVSLSWVLLWAPFQS